MKTFSLSVVCALGLHLGLAQADAPASGLDLAGFDKSVRPQDDLFLAVNGRWLQNTAIPPDKAEYGLFYELRDRADERVKTLVEELAAKPAAPGSVEQKIGSFYRSYMDEAAIDKAGLAPVAPWLAQIDAIKTKHALAAMMGRLQGVAGTPVAMMVDSDAKEPGINRAIAWQDGLGLPDRDYYLKDDARFAKAREAYLQYLRTVLQASGDAHAARDAQTVFALEKQLAGAQWSRVQNRDPVKVYNPMTLKQLARSAPGFDWQAFLAAASLPAIDRLSVGQPSYAKAMASSIAHTPLATWKLYLRVRMLDGSAKTLPQAFRQASYEFRGQALQGLQQDKPRWQHATRALDSALGEAVGQAYVARYFPPAYKARMQELVANLLATFGDSIDSLSWMGPETKREAHAKLAKYLPKIGYPDKWRDYSALEIRDGDAFGNDLRAGRFEWERMARKAGKPVDRSEWLMTPQTVNAYYNPNFNEIVFPAAILEPPFFDMSADDAANYGAIGAIIGHEISHGFDDTGSQYDGDGKLRNWWTEADHKAFAALGDKLVAQYDAYEALPGHHLNGRLTLGENIADLSGLQIAFKAYHRALKGQAAPVIDGYSGDQRFYLSFAQAFRGKRREERALQLLTIDTHSPEAFRVDGTVTNADGFHQAFGTQPGDKLYKPSDARVRIW